MYQLPMMETYLKYGNPLPGMAAARLFFADKKHFIDKDAILE
jgi:hypothetical protein